MTSLQWTYAAVAAVLVFGGGELRADDADQRTQPALRFGGFADVELHTTSENDREGLDLLELDVFSTLQLSNHWSALAEGVGERNWRRDEHLIEADLERFYVEYSRSDAFRLEIGQTQTGIIDWNEREHRSRFLQTPIDVPAIARRPEEDGAWPLQFIGAWASGRAPGSLGITWGAGAGAGPGRERNSIRIIGADRSPAALLSVSSSPDRVPGLEFGVTAYVAHVRTEPEPMRQRDVTFSVNYVRSGNEIRAEWARMNHHLAAAPETFRTTGYYALFSRRLSGRAANLRPYFLLDRLKIDDRETYLKDATDENAWAIGVRCDVNQRFSIKTEYRSQRAVNGDRESVAGIQFGFSF